MSQHITIRAAGPYTITTDGRHLYCNGRATSAQLAPTGVARAGVAVTHLVDTLSKGANGHNDRVGLTAAEYKIYRDAFQAQPIVLSLRGQRDVLAAAYNDLREAAHQADHDAIEALRNGRMTTRPQDRSAEITAARQAIAAFDAAHPEVLAEIAADKAAGINDFLAND